jgi:hypothetical protein
MTSLLPIIEDILPIIMPSTVHVTKASELDAGTSQTQGMIRKGAIVGKSDKICASGKSVSLGIRRDRPGSLLLLWILCRHITTRLASLPQPCFGFGCTTFLFREDFQAFLSLIWDLSDI